MDQDAHWGEHSWGPWNIELYGGSFFPYNEGEGELGKILAVMDPLHISGMTEARDLKFCMRVEGWGP